VPSEPRDRQDAQEFRRDVVARLAALPPLKRRALLLGALGAAGLAACSPAPTPPTAVPGATTAPSAAAPGAGAAASPAAGGASQPKQGGVYKAASTSDAVTLHPYKATDTGSRAYINYLYAGGMTKYDPNTLEPQPNMAERWEVSADKLTYNWYLRKDVKWSDGKPLTSDDWLWTFQQVANPDNKYPYKSSTVDPIADITAPEPYRLVVKLKEPLVVGLEQADPPNPLPRHVWEKYDWNDPAKNPEVSQPTVVSGMFKLKTWRRDDYAEFEANDLYWQGRPLLDGMLIRIVPDPNVAYQMLKSGEIDSGIVQPNDFDEAKAHPLLKLYQWEPAVAQWDYIGFNLRRPILQDAALRRALAFATNRNAISKAVYNDLARPTFSAYPPTSWVYNPDVPKYDLDPKKAAEELDAAGWKLAPGAKVRSKDGQQLNLKLLFGPNTSKQREQTAVIAQQAYAEIGVGLTVQGMEWGAFLATIKKEPFDWDLQVGGWQATLDPHWMVQIWSQASIPELNAGAYVSKRVEELFDQGSKEFDRDKRKKVYQEIQQILSTDLPYIFLVYGLGWTFLNKRVHVNAPTKLGINYERHKWWIE
jgi:peptide/nickel transport system substrate-binding protein